VSSVLFDADFLTLLFHPTAQPPNDPATGKPVEFAQKRIASLIEELHKEGVRIVIPTPALAEFLVIVGDGGSDYLARIDRSSQFEVAPYDERAAVETAVALKAAISAGDKRSGLANTPWQKLKLDRQIVAIAKSRGIRVIYSTDHDVAILARQSGIEMRHVADLPIPEDDMPLLRGLEPES